MLKKIVIYEVYDGGFYGNAKYIFTLMKYALNKPYEMVLITPNRSSLSERVEKIGGTYIQAKAPKRLCKYGGIVLKERLILRILTGISIIGYTIKLVNILRKFKAEIVQCHNIRSLLTISLAAKLIGCKLIWYIKGELENPVLDRIGYIVADEVLFQSRVTKDQKYPNLVEKYDYKVNIVENAIDMVEIDNVTNTNLFDLKEEIKIKKELINIGYIGRICEKKGIHYLINALNLLNKSGVKYFMYFVGDKGIEEFGSYKMEVRKMIVKYNLQNNIAFIGWRKDAIAIMSLMDIFVLPSTSEGVPKSIIEAMALGKAVIASNVGGVSSIITNNYNGVMVPPKNATLLYKALLRVSKNNDIRYILGENSRKTASDKFAFDQHYCKLETIYHRLINEQRQ